MSSYINFYIKTPDNKFIPIISFPRSHHIYNEFKYYCEYGEGTPITKTICDCIVKDVSDYISRLKEGISTLKGKKESIADFKNNSIEEKLEAITEIDDSIHDDTKIIDEYQYVEHFAEILGSMIEDIRWFKDYNECKFIYAGIEWCPEGCED